MKKSLFAIMMVNIILSVFVLKNQDEVFLTSWIIPVGLLVMYLVSFFETRKEKEWIKKLINVSLFSQMVILVFQIIFLIKETEVRMEEEVLAGVFVGFVIYILGTYMQKTKRNWWFGLRLVWTYHSEEVWKGSNQFSGLMLIIASPIVILLSILFEQDVEFAIAIPLLLAITISIIQSYICYKKETKNK